MRSNRYGNEVIITRWKRNQNEDVYNPPPKPYSMPSKTESKAWTTVSSPQTDVSYVDKSSHTFGKKRFRSPSLISNNSISDGAISEVPSPKYYTYPPKADPAYWKNYPASPPSLINWNRCLSPFCIVVSVLVVMIVVLAIVLILIFGLDVFRRNKMANGDNVTSTTQSVVTVIEKSKMLFYDLLRNATDADEYCRNRESRLLTIENEEEELRLFKEIRNNLTLMRHCKNAYLGYRSVQDKEWETANDEYSFHAMYTNIWSQLSYELPLEICSHSTKVLDYKLNSIPCNFLNDCVMCQFYNEHSCTDNNWEDGTCFILEKHFTNHYEEGVKFCKELDGSLASVPNARIYKRFRDVILDERNKDKKCSNIAVGMVLKRKIETIYAEDEIKYTPKSFNPTLGSIEDNCLVVSLHGISNTIKFVDCKAKNCFICINEK